MSSVTQFGEVCPWEKEDPSPLKAWEDLAQNQLDKLWSYHIIRVTHNLAREGFPSGSDSKKNLPAMQETRVQSLVGKILCRREWLPTPAFLPGESQGQSSLAGCSPRGCKSRTRRRHYHLSKWGGRALSSRKYILSPESGSFPGLPYLQSALKGRWSYVSSTLSS